MREADNDEIDLRGPPIVADNAAKGLRLREEFGRGGTEVGVARATGLKNREKLSPSTIRRMVSYFARHEVDKRGKITAMRPIHRPAISHGCCGAATKAARGRLNSSGRWATHLISERPADRAAKCRRAPNPKTWDPPGSG